jgi:beta-glucosidase
LFDRGYGLSYATPGQVAPLSEDPKMDLAAAIDVNRLVTAGQPSGPWTLTIADDAGGRTVTTSRASSMGGKLTMSPVDLTAQEDGRLFAWSGPARLSLDGPAADFTRQLNNAFALRLDLRVDQVGGPVRLSFAGKSLDIAPQLRRLPRGSLATLKVPLRCFADAGASVASVGTPMLIEAGSGTQFAIRSAVVEAVGENLTCPPL